MALDSRDLTTVYNAGFSFTSICRQLTTTCHEEYILAVKDSSNNRWQITASTPDLIQRMRPHLPHEFNRSKHEGIPYANNKSDELSSLDKKQTSRVHGDDQFRCQDKETTERAEVVEINEQGKAKLSNCTSDNNVNVPAENLFSCRSSESRLWPEDTSADKRPISEPMTSDDVYEVDIGCGNERNVKRKKMDDGCNILSNSNTADPSHHSQHTDQNRTNVKPSVNYYNLVSSERGIETPIISEIQSVNESITQTSQGQGHSEKSFTDKTSSEITVLSQTAIPSLVEAIRHLRKDLTKLSQTVEQNSRVTSTMSEQFMQAGWSAPTSSRIYDPTPADDIKLNITEDEQPEQIDLESECKDLADFGEDKDFLHSHARYIIRMLSQDEIDTITLIQRKMFPGLIVSGKKLYPGLRGKHFMTRVADFGFGDVFHGKTTKSLIFKRRPLSLMNKICQNFCRSTYITVP